MQQGWPCAVSRLPPKQATISQVILPDIDEEMPDGSGKYGLEDIATLSNSREAYWYFWVDGEYFDKYTTSIGFSPGRNKHVDTFTSGCQVDSETYTLLKTGRQDAVRKSDGIDQLKLTLSKRMQYDQRCDACYTRAIDAGISLAGEGTIGMAGAEPAVAG